MEWDETGWDRIGDAPRVEERDGMRRNGKSGREREETKS